MKTLAKTFLTVFILFFATANAFAADVYLYVTRHGKTMFNTVHRAQGWSDTPLTAPGIEVAKQLGRGVKDVNFLATYSSDLGRARETARIVLEAKGAPADITEMRQLREVCFGQFEGDLDPNMWGPAAKHLGYASEAALMADFAKGNIAINRMADAITAVDRSGQAETYQQVKSRMQEALTKIAKQAQEKGGGNVLVVSHGMAITAMIHEMTDIPVTRPLGNASVTLIRYTEKGQFIVESIDDMSYVEKGKR